MPRLEAAMLADSAQDYGGKVSILGGFVSILNVPTVPTAYMLQFVGRVAFSRDELGVAHQVEVTATDDSAEIVFRANAPVLPARETPNGVFVESGMNILVPLFLNIGGPGIYVVRLEVDGEELAQLPLQVVLLPQPTP